MMDDLVTWLRAQLDWAEDDSSSAHILGCKIFSDDGVVWPDGEAPTTDPEQCDCKVRFRLLDIAAKRAILDTFEEARTYYDGPGRSAPAGEVHGLWTALQHLASAYADRVGYQEGWKP